MAILTIDVTDLGGEAHPEDRVVLWKPATVGSASAAGRIISTAPVTVKLVGGKATVEGVEPGPMRVLLQCRGVESTGPVTVTMPESAGQVTLRSLFESQFEYSPPIVSAVQAAANKAADSERGAIQAQVRSTAAADRAAESESSAKTSETSARGSADRAAESESSAKTSETNALDAAARAEFAAEETIQQVTGDFATRNYTDTLADSVRWAHDTPDPSWNIEDFPKGIWKIENSAQRTRLRLPNSFGVMAMHVYSPDRQSVQNAKAAYWLSLSHSSPTQMLIRSTSNTGVWEPEWQPPFRYEPPTKQAAVPLTFPRGSSYSDDRPTVTMRIPFKLGAAVKRARIRLRNYDYRSDHGFPGSYRIVGAGIGKHQINPDGSMTGLVPEGETITQLMGSTQMSGPAEAKGDWVTVDLEPNTDYLLSYSITSDAGMVYARQTAQCFTNRLSSGWNRTGSVTATPSGMGPLSAILDVEVLKEVPIYGYLGDSQTAAISAARPGYDSWAMVHSRLEGAIPTIHAHAGAGLQEWQSASKPAYGVSDGMAKFDRMHISMGSNDISGGRPLTGVQEYLTNVMANWRKQTDTFVLHNYLPRTGSNSTDAVRDGLNDWLRANLPGGALYTVDVFGSTVDPETGLMDERWRASVSDVHMSSAGNARIALATVGTGGGGTEVKKLSDTLHAALSSIPKDTGWRDVKSLATSQISIGQGGYIHIRRVGDTVTWKLCNVVLSNVSTDTNAINIPLGFRQDDTRVLLHSGPTDTQPASLLLSSSQWFIRYRGSIVGPISAAENTLLLSYTAPTNSWPSTLPGTPI